MSISSFSELKTHIGHQIECVSYGDQKNAINVAIECITCNEVLFDFEAEEKMKQIYQDTLMMSCPSLTSAAIDEAYREGIRDALRIHGISYDWLDGDAE